MKNKKKKSILVLLMSAVMLLGFVVQTAAAIPNISSVRYLRTYPLSTGNDTYVYTSSSLSTRGTSSPRREYNAVIYASDEVYVYSINGGSAYVSYPTSSGRRYGYIKTNAVISGNYSQAGRTSSAKITTYMRPGGSVYGSISRGDLVYATGRSGSCIQVIYPVGSQYKMGWIAASSYDQYIDGSSNGSGSYGSSSGPVPDGLYKVVSVIDKRHVWDISNASADDGANLQLWEDNGTNAQKFWFSYNSDGYYTIKNINSGKVVDCDGAGSADGTNIQQYTSNRTDAQRWKLVQTGSGCFTMVCKCNGKVIDAAGGIASSGTNIQIYESNGTAAQKFMLVETTQGIENAGLENSVDTNSSARAAAVIYMNEMASVVWTPHTTFNHWSYGSSNRHKWYEGTTYYGIPYTQEARNTSLEDFRGQLSGGVYVGPSSQRTYKGNDCSSAVSYAYRSVNASFPILSTHSMYPVSGNMRRVGNYEHYNSTSSSTICTKNGRSVINNSYQSLQPGDLLLTSAGAHVMMVTETGENYVKVTHQTTYDSLLHSTWRVNEKWSFDSLYNKRYIPVTMAAW